MGFYLRREAAFFGTEKSVNQVYLIGQIVSTPSYPAEELPPSSNSRTIAYKPLSVISNWIVGGSHLLAPLRPYNLLGVNLYLCKIVKVTAPEPAIDEIPSRKRI